MKTVCQRREVEVDMTTTAAPRDSRLTDLLDSVVGQLPRLSFGAWTHSADEIT